MISETDNEKHEIECKVVLIRCSGDFSLPEVVSGLMKEDSRECTVGDAGGNVVDFCTGSSALGVVIVIREYVMSLVTKTKSYSNCD